MAGGLLSGIFEDKPEEGYGIGMKQPDDEQRKEIKRLMKKHGIDQGQAVVIGELGKAPYFVRDGKKIKFQ